MQEFLRPQIRRKTIAKLIELGINPDRAEQVTLIQEGDQDNHLYAHASICVELFDQALDEEQENTRAVRCVVWSSVCANAIAQEAKERGMPKDAFPKGAPYMDALCAKVEAANRKQATLH